MHFQRSEFACKHCGKGEDVIRDWLIACLEALRVDWGRPMVVASGYRCPEHNSEIGGAAHSAHLTGEAVDIRDPDGALKRYCTAEVLEKHALWAEDYAATPTWIHLQIRPASQRIFKK